MRELSLSCSCGGTVTVKIQNTEKTAAAECACGRLVLWSDEMLVESKPVSLAPPTLGISVSDSINTKDKFGS